MRSGRPFARPGPLPIGPIGQKEGWRGPSNGMTEVLRRPSAKVPPGTKAAQTMPDVSDLTLRDAFDAIEPEREDGNVEYKRILTDESEERVQRLRMALDEKEAAAAASEKMGRLAAAGTAPAPPQHMAAPGSHRSFAVCRVA